MFTNAVIEPAIGEKASGRPVNTRQSGHGSFDLMIETLVAGLTPGPWILGQRFTAPDVTPKNLLIQAARTGRPRPERAAEAQEFMRRFGIKPRLAGLL